MVRKAPGWAGTSRAELLPASTHLSSMAIKSASASNKDRVSPPAEKGQDPVAAAYLPPPCSLPLAGQRRRAFSGRSLRDCQVSE